MAYIGNTVQNQGFAPAIDYFNGNGVTVTFTLSRPVASVAQVIVAVDNVIQNPSSAFGVVGNSITFTSAPLSGTNNIWVEYTSLITTYQGISQDPTVIGDIRATGGYLAEGDFGNSFVDGNLIDYVTGRGRFTVGELDDITFYHGGTSGRSAMMDLYYAGGAKIYGTTALTIPVGTTAQRPGTPAFGMIRGNTTTGYIEYYNSATSSWSGIGEYQATGGTVTTYSSGGVNYKVHTFTTSGTYTVTAGTANIDYLVVAAGGGGGPIGGGGGAGGVLVGSIASTFGAYSIVIGGGGTNGQGGSTPATNGGNTTALGLTAIGGGGGGQHQSGGSSTSGLSGGSGGGGADNGTPGGAGTSGQGNAGGTGIPSLPSTQRGGGGGGGAGAAGASATSSGMGNGGNGIQSGINGTTLYWGGGGGGGGYESTTAGNGGLGGGGGGSVNTGTAGTGGGSALNSGDNGVVATNARGGSGGANTGGGGGGCSWQTPSFTAQGGSGIVIIRYIV